MSSYLRGYNEIVSQDALPLGTQLLRAGATGAMVGGGLSVAGDLARVRDQQISRDEAVSRAARKAAMGASAGVAVSLAARVARRHPVTGLAAVLAFGAGALYLAGRARVADADIDDAAAAPTSSQQEGMTP
ncbi:MAG: hypothetical protein H6843_14120 [Rhodospirillaceae bacterium]|nr:hypothetical protein [Rhodospirillaceae bacterium]